MDKLSDIRECEVCRREKPIAGVASSVLGAASFAYCHECVANGAEAFPAVLTTVWTCGFDGVSEWAKEITFFKDGQYIKIKDAREYLEDEVKKLDAQYNQWMKEDMEKREREKENGG